MLRLLHGSRRGDLGCDAAASGSPACSAAGRDRRDLPAVVRRLWQRSDSRRLRAEFGDQCFTASPSPARAEASLWPACSTRAHAPMAAPVRRRDVVRGRRSVRGHRCGSVRHHVHVQCGTTELGFVIDADMVSAARATDPPRQIPRRSGRAGRAGAPPRSHAIAALLQRLHHGCRGRAHVLGRDASDVEDVAQESLVASWARSRRFVGTATSPRSRAASRSAPRCDRDESGCGAGGSTPIATHEALYPRPRSAISTTSCCARVVWRACGRCSARCPSRRPRPSRCGACSGIRCPRSQRRPHGHQHDPKPHSPGQAALAQR